jgi:hypothetical protein
MYIGNYWAAEYTLRKLKFDPNQAKWTNPVCVACQYGKAYGMNIILTLVKVSVLMV